NIPKAIAFYEQAIARDPNYALAYAGLAKAYILLPFYTGADRRDASVKAKEAALKALRLDSNLAEAHVALGKVLFFSEIDLAGAIAEYEKAKQLSDNTYVSMLCAQAKAYAGDKDAAVRMLSDLDKISQQREVVGYLRALLYLSLNNKDEALRWLEQGFEERDGSNISWIKVDPLLDPLHGDPRFESLVQKVVAPKS